MQDTGLLCRCFPGAGTQAGIGELPAERAKEAPSWEVRRGPWVSQSEGQGSWGVG